MILCPVVCHSPQLQRRLGFSVSNHIASSTKFGPLTLSLSPAKPVERGQSQAFALPNVFRGVTTHSITQPNTLGGEGKLTAIFHSNW